ncbi:hypothetical protein [[Eubacterium] hominis]|uniref:D-alanyl-D-alanine carboxypeptidase family protein n=1 Tax=[Eubacterium] hominis TaxID=2764325 RepID=UPI0022E23377
MKGKLKKIFIFITIIILLIQDTPVLYAKEKDFPIVNSEYYLMMNLTNHSVEFEKGQNEKIYPASMTKIMTCLLVIENTRHFDKQITISSKDLKGLDEERSSRAGFVVGEKITVEDGLHGALLASGGDAARAIARHMAGSEKEFVNLMNKKAAFLGMNDTHFTNPIGLHDINHYTTLHDMAILFEYAMNDDKFKEIVSCPEYHVLSNMHDDLGFLNSMYYIMDHHDIDHRYMIGQKSGYTPEAGLCLSSMEEKDGQKYLLITAKADKEKNEVGNFEDAQTLYQYVFKKNKKKILIQEGEIIGNVTIGLLVKDTLSIKAIEDIFISTGDQTKIQWHFQSDEIPLFLTKGKQIGKVIGECDGKQVFEKIIYTERLIISKELIIIGSMLILMIICIGVYYRREGNHEKRSIKKNK